jgi:Tfp pilus assembly protein PilF
VIAGRRLVARAATLLALACALAACKPPGPAQTRQSRPDTSAAGKPGYDKILAGYNEAIASGETMTKGPLESAAVPLELASLYTERASLTGDYGNYARAEDLLGRLDATFGDTDAVCVAKAKLHYTLHRLAKAKQVLDGCPRIAGQPADLGLRADIAFYSGRYKDAGIIYRALVNQLGTPQSYIQLALYSAKTGAPGEAAAFLEAAEKRYYGGSAVTLSWLALQRGLIELDRGRDEEARALFALADQRLPGYWLNEEHLAEATRLNGDAAAARKIYEDVVKKTGAPEYLDALAQIDADAGDAAAATPLLSRAEAIYDQRAKRFPEAIAGHALEHYLKAAPQPAKALALAQANYANRPYGEAAIALAKAQLLNHRPHEAAQLLERELAKGWDTPEAWWVLSLAAEASGDAGRAKTASLEALRRNPGSATQYAFKF